jgi:hypothetical protein
LRDRVDPLDAMKNCPKCSFLMGDDEVLCGPCTAQPDRSFPLDDPQLPPTTGGRGSTLLLDPETLTTRPSEVRYRGRSSSGVSGRTVALVVVVLGVVGVLGAMALRGDGPLASMAVDLGLADPPAVVVPENWSTLTSTEGKFSVELPAGAVAHDAPVDPAAPELGQMVGFRVPLGERGEMLALWTDFGLGPDRLRDIDDAAFGAVVDQLIARSRLGEETVRRDGIVNTGRAVDSVLADGEDSTTRARFQLVGGRLHVLVTRGAEEGARDLDAAHQRLIAGFESTA